VYLLELKGTLFLVERACHAVRKAGRKHLWGSRGGSEGAQEQWNQGMAELRSWEYLTGIVTASLSQLQAYCTVSPGTALLLPWPNAIHPRISWLLWGLSGT